MDYYGVIYRATNIINNKIYIGQTIDFNKRKARHIKQSKIPKTHFERAINKYGEDKFIWEIICHCSDKADLNQKEIEFIDFYGGINSDLNYNSREGGTGGRLCSESLEKMKTSRRGVPWSKKRRAACKNKPLSDEQKKKISESIKNRYKNDPVLRKKQSENSKKRKHTQETKNKLSEMRMGDKNPRFGVKESRESIDKRLKNKKHTSLGKKCKLTITLTNEVVEAKSIAELARKTNLTLDLIQCLRYKNASKENLNKYLFEFIY